MAVKRKYSTKYKKVKRSVVRGGRRFKTTVYKKKKGK